MVSEIDLFITPTITYSKLLIAGVPFILSSLQSPQMPLIPSVKVNNSEWIHTPGKYQGTGFKPTLDLGIEKGYKFILHTGNMFFIRSDLFDKLNITYDNPLENFRTNWGGRI